MMETFSLFNNAAGTCTFNTPVWIWLNSVRICSNSKDSQEVNRDKTLLLFWPFINYINEKRFVVALSKLNQAVHDTLISTIKTDSDAHSTYIKNTKG